MEFSPCKTNNRFTFPNLGYNKLETASELSSARMMDWNFTLCEEQGSLIVFIWSREKEENSEHKEENQM